MKCFRSSIYFQPKIFNLSYIDSGWGWKDREKLNEMKDTNSRFLVAQDELARPIAFINFRFDIDYGVPVVYW